MSKKNLFTALVLLNSFFYLGIAVALYWHQNRSLEQDTLVFYDRQTAMIRAEISGRKEFYQNWLSHIRELPESPEDRHLFLKMSGIHYLGRFQGAELISLSPSTRPPFPLSILKDNPHYLFHKEAGKLYFTYSYRHPKTEISYVVTVEESSVSFTRRLEQVGAHIVILEKAAQAPPLALFSSLGETQTKELTQKFSVQENQSRSVRLTSEKFYIIPSPLLQSTDLQQTFLVAFNRSEFFFTLSLGMAVLLLALFCVNSGLLFYGYMKTQDEND